MYGCTANSTRRVILSLCFVQSILMNCRTQSGPYEWTTFEQVHRRALCIAEAIKAISPRSFLAICCPNCPEWLITDFACTYQNLIVVGIHISWPQSEVEHVLLNSEAICAVANLANVDKFIEAAQRAPSLRYLIVITRIQGRDEFDIRSIEGGEKEMAGFASGLHVFYFDELETGAKALPLIASLKDEE